MKSILSRAPLFALAALATSAYGAAQCPADPLLALSGRWTFNIQGTPTNRALNHDFAIAGQFVASATRPGFPSPNGVGWLTITATSWINGSVTRLESDIGRYQLNADCSGGSLIMNLSSYPMQYDFWFQNGGQSMHIVSTVNGKPAIGSATLAPAGCPAGVSAIDLLSGFYTFRYQGVPWLPAPFGIAGVFEASRRPLFNPSFLDADRGRLDVRATSNLGFGGSVARLEGDVGHYSVNADCLGGTLTFNLSSQPVQYQFYFRTGFADADVISISPAAQAFGPVVRQQIRGFSNATPIFGVFSR